jgi:hypothetical protein
MTEAEWLACADPDEMTTVFIDIGSLSDRKLRLFGCACVRRLWHWLDDERSRNAVVVAERFTEGQAGTKEVDAAADLARERTDDLVVYRDGEHWLDGSPGQASQAASGAANPDALNVARLCAWSGATAYEILGEGTTPADGSEAGKAFAEQERHRQASLARDVFGNPFRPVSFDPSWQTPAVSSLAHAAYDHRILPSGDWNPPASRSLPTPSKKPAARTPTSSTT